MSKRQILIVIGGIAVIFVISAGLFIIFSGMKQERKPQVQPTVIRKVSSELVKYSNVETSVKGNGRVLSSHSIDIMAEVQGKLLQGNIELKNGSNFREGDLLVKIYDTEAVYAIQSRKSSFLNLIAGILPDLKIDYPESYQKWVDFFEAIRIDEDLPVLPESGSNQEKIFLASNSILSTYFSIKSDEVRLKKYNIYAPFDGAIQEVNLEIGSVANPGSRIASVIRTGQLEIEVPIDINSAKWVYQGQQTNIRGEDNTSIGKGVVTRKSRFVDPENQSINIYVQILPGSEPIYTGQYLEVEIPGMNIQNAMEIPRNAVFNQNLVFVVDSGYLAKREIEVIKVNEKTLVFNGIEEGVELVTQPLANANANIPVQTDLSNYHMLKPSGNPGLASY